VRIETVDPDDDVALAAWCAVVDEVARDARPGDQPDSVEEHRVRLARALLPDAVERVVALLARDGDAVVGAAEIELPLRDNLHYAELAVRVPPAHRRRGVGTALAHHAERLAREAGRRTLAGEVDEPPGRPAAGAAFAERLGGARVLEEVRRDLDLPLDPSRARVLAGDAAPYAGDVELRTWRSRCPDDLVADLAVLLQRMSTDTPVGALDVQEEAWDVARVRQKEESALAQGRTVFGAGAVDRPTGRMVAFTRIAVPAHAPERAHQWETLVLREHRGRRLGTLVKLACLDAVSAGSPASRLVTTWNAADNAPMIRVNDALGARTNGGMSFWQKAVA
jgi:GNAT superfamily N-acetyltransferase